MNYWLLTTEYPPMHGGGISTYCYFTAQMLAAAGDEITVFVPDDAEADFSITVQAKNIKLVKFNSQRENLQQTLGYTAALSYAFAGMVRHMIAREGAPDYIEAQDYLGIAYYLTQYKHAGYSFLANIPIIITLHSPAFIYLLYNRVPVYRFPDFWTGEMEKQAIAAADGIVAPTHFIVEEVKKHMSLEGKQVTVIANPYHFTIAPVPSVARNKILYYGKLSPQKGSFELLAYCKALWDEGFPHPLHIVGGTDIVFHPEMKTMGQLVQAQYAPYISKGLLQLHGKIAPADIEHHLRDAHLVIVPSIVDNMPYVVMEAMSLGKVVLASQQGGQREMINDGINGYLFSHEEPGSFAATLKKILALSDESIQTMGARAQEKIAQDYAPEKIWAQKKAFLQALTPLSTNQFPFLYQEPMQELTNGAVISGLLSVVIPYFNMGAFIAECLSSLLASHYQHLEIIIVNDGSTEAASLAQLKALRTEKRIRVIDQLNGGLAAARNAGARASSGEYLAFLDADDKVAPDYYTKAITALQKNTNVFFAGCWAKYFENSTQLWPSFTPQPPYALVHNMVNSSGLVYKKNAFLAAGLNDAKAGYGLEDYESVVHMIASGFNGIVLPEALFYYRVRTGSMFRKITTEKLLYAHHYIATKHAAYFTRYAIPVMQLLQANGPGYSYDNPTFATKITVSSGPEGKYNQQLKQFVKRNVWLKKIALQILKIKNKR